MLISSYVHNVDAKSRVFIPVKFRLDLGSRFYVCCWIDGCIRAYGEAEWEEVLQKLRQTNVRSSKLKRRILSSAAEVEMDSQGRMLLPEVLRTKAEITDQVEFVGMDGWVELWSPEKYDSIMGDDFEEDDIDMLSELGL